MSEPQPEPDVGAEALLIGEITVREFLTAADGERYYDVDYGDMPLSTALGMLRLAEHWIISEHLDPDDDGE